MASSKVHFLSPNTTLLSNLIGKNLIIIAHSLNANVLPRPITNRILLFVFSKDWRMGFLSFVPKSYSWTLCLRFLACSPWLCNKSANTLFPLSQKNQIFLSTRGPRLLERDAVVAVVALSAFPQVLTCAILLTKSVHTVTALVTPLRRAMLNTIIHQVIHDTQVVLASIHVMVLSL